MNPLSRVLLVDDDDDLRLAHIQSLTLAGLTVEGVASADLALKRVDAAFEGVIVSDIRMPGMDGLSFAARVREIDGDLPFILMTGHGDIEMAVRSLQQGVFDFLSKPFATERLVSTVRRALSHRSLVLENRRMADLLVQASLDSAETGLIGQAPAIVRLRETLAQIARTDSDVLIEGESGVGKELTARSLHRLSRRARRPFVVVNCAALPEATFDTELFGRPISSSGMGRRIGGRVREAAGGTLLLDEIDALPPALQAKLLRLVEHREIPAQAEGVEHVDIRIVATSKVDLAQASGRGDFRSDIYYRLSVITLRLPPLRERRSDIDLLFRHFVDRYSERQGKPSLSTDDTAAAWLSEHDWPGNVRELAYFAERFVIGLSAPQALQEKDLSMSLSQRVQRFEAKLIQQALIETGGNVRETVQRLGIPRKTFYDKITRHGLSLDAFRGSDR